MSETSEGQASRTIRLMDGIEIVQPVAQDDEDAARLARLAETQVTSEQRRESHKKRVMEHVEAQFMKGVPVPITDEIRELGLVGQVNALGLKIGGMLSLLEAMRDRD